MDTAIVPGTISGGCARVMTPGKVGESNPRLRHLKVCSTPELLFAGDPHLIAKMSFLCNVIVMAVNDGRSDRHFPPQSFAHCAYGLRQHNFAIGSREILSPLQRSPIIAEEF